MAMNGSVLGQAIYKSLIGDKLDESDNRDEVVAAWETIAAEIVSHIQTYAEVPVTIVTTGSQTTQTGSTTAKVN